MYSLNLNLKQCLAITMLMFGSVQTLAKSICDYPLEDIPEQILYVTIYGSDGIMLIITRDLTVFELNQVNVSNYVANSSMALKDKFRKLYDSSDFLAYKSSGFAVPMFGRKDTLNFVSEQTNDKVTRIFYQFDGDTKEYNFKPDGPLDDIFSKKSIWIGMMSIDSFFVLQKIQSNFRFISVNFQLSLSPHLVNIEQGPYICKGSSEKDHEIVFSNDTCPNPWDDEVFKQVNFDGNGHHSCYIFAQKQVYVYDCISAPYESALPFKNLTVISYNRFFSCGHAESSSTRLDSNSLSTGSLIAELTSEKSGFPMIVIIIIMVLIIAGIIILVVVYFFCCKQDKSAGASKKKPSSSKSSIKEPFSKHTSKKHSNDHNSSKARVTSKKENGIAAGSKVKKPKVKQSKVASSK